MIHHISIAANNPLHVAQVLAELFQGDVMPFPEHEGSYVALTYDPHGTLIVVLPKGTELMPNLPDDSTQVVADADTDAGSQFVHNPYIPTYTATHAAISVPVSEAQIREIAAREGWHVAHCNRQDFFEVIEFWLENQVLIELLPPTIAPKYTAFMQPESLKQFAATMAAS